MNRIPSTNAMRNEPRRVADAATGFIKKIIAVTHTAVTALAIMHAGTPSAAITSPAIGGPITAGALNASELRPIAFPMNSRGTSSETQL